MPGRYGDRPIGAFFMSNGNYKSQYLHPKWQKKRLKILNRDDFKCCRCKSEEKTLHVHHKYYINDGRKVWEYPNEALITLCEGCHETEHINMESDFERYLLLRAFDMIGLPCFEHVDVSMKCYTEYVTAIIAGMSGYAVPQMKDENGRRYDLIGINEYGEYDSSKTYLEMIFIGIHHNMGLGQFKEYTKTCLKEGKIISLEQK